MKTSKGIGIGIGVIIAIIVVFMLIQNAPKIQQNVITQVDVSGNAHTTGIGTKAVFIDFTDTNSGQTISTNVNGGSYDQSLANNHSYNIVVHYSEGFGAASGTCQAGVLSLYSTTSSMQRDISC